ncbi:polysaccharide deacetylase family protein [Magnetospira sp. QH-2]|uniref:polysaccharide deacetylase family protein n=1 Tax=Magnetospira sp. (strain QH-2) TaxID=1288970 RepID=UPI0005FA4B3D|nr:polysaccharide deacetylase family protein [Magnetospira sp. QH-2]
MTDPFAPLNAELDAWRLTGRRATLWWRDDDATEPSAPLDRLLACSADRGIPLTLAVIPQPATRSLADRLAGNSLVRVAQHGLAHSNHGSGEEKKIELGGTLNDQEVARHLGDGRAILDRLFGPQMVPMMVPPWNRIRDSVVKMLPDLGYRALSTFKPRAAPVDERGLRLLNTHVDIVDWSHDARFPGAERVIATLVNHLKARRENRVEPFEPTGLLTHHLVNKNESWDFLDQLGAMTRAHPAADWVTWEEQT